MIKNTPKAPGASKDLYRDGLRLRIARAIRISGKTKAEIAKECEVSQQAVYGWQNTGRVGKDTLAKIAKSTNTTLEWLVSGDESALERQTIRTVTVPLFNWDLTPGGSVENIQTDGTIGANAFALRVRGNAMAGEFPDGTTIIVDPDVKPTEGKFVIAEVDGATLLRQVQFDGGRTVLTATDPSFQAIRLDTESPIIGVVVSSHKRY